MPTASAQRRIARLAAAHRGPSRLPLAASPPAPATPVAARVASASPLRPSAKQPVPPGSSIASAPRPHQRPSRRRRQRPGRTIPRRPRRQAHLRQPCILLSAHLDTVFPAGHPLRSDRRTRHPASSLPASATTPPASPLCSAIAAALRYAEITPPVPSSSPPT